MMGKENGEEERNRVPSVVYTEDYYLTDNEGFREYEKGLSENIHPKFKRALKYAGLRPGMQVLDLGCGRGERYWGTLFILLCDFRIFQRFLCFSLLFGHSLTLKAFRPQLV